MIKNWTEFINEAKQLDLFPDEGIFTFTEEDLSDYLLELEESGYFCSWDFGWLDETNLFTRKIKGHIAEPCIKVEINKSHKVSSEDLTSSVTTFINRMLRKARIVKLYDEEDNSPLDIRNLKFEGGIFINENPEDSEPDESGVYHDIELEHGIYILCVFGKRKLSYVDIFEYYGIVGEKLNTNQGVINCLSFDEKGVPIFEVEVDDLTRWLVKRGDSYVEYITNPDKIWDNYLGHSDYLPDHSSFFQYTLNKENIELLLRVCIKKDGWDEIKSQLENSNISEEEFIQNSVKDFKSYDKLGKMIKDLPISGEIYEELRRMYTDFEESAKAQEDLDEIISKFDSLVEAQFKTSIVSKNRYTRKATVTNKQGEKREYEQEFQTYKLLFNFDWFERLSDDEIEGTGTTNNILLEYTSHLYSENLNPNFSDYASVDDVEFNKSVKSDLEYHLKRTE